MPGITAYDQPAQAQFVNTYSPIPFQEILQAGQGRQQQYDVNRANFERMVDESNDLRAMPGADTAYIEGTVIPTMQEISDQYRAQDYGNPEVVRQISKQLTDKIDRRLVANIQQSYGGYQQYQDDLRKLTLSGGTVPPELMINPRQHDTSSYGIFSGTPEKALNLEGRAREYFKNIEPKYKGVRVIDKAQGIMGLVHGVDQTVLNQRVADIADEFLNTPEGQQFTKIQQARGNNDIKGAAVQFLSSIGKEELKDKVTSTYRQERPSGAGDEDRKIGLDTTSPSEAIDLGLPKPISTKFIQARDFNEQGQLKTRNVVKPLVPFRAMANSVKKALEDSNYHITKDNLKKEFDKIADKYWKGNKKKEQETINAVKTTYPSLASLSDQKAIDAYENAVKDFSVQSINLVGTTSDISKEYTRRFVNDNIRRDMMILDSHGKTGYDREEVLSELGKTEEELLSWINDPGNKKMTGGFTHQGPQPGMFYVEVPDKKGNMRRVMFSSNDNIKNATSISNSLYNSMLTMLPSIVQTGASDAQGNPIDYQIIPNIDPNTQKFNYTILEGQKTVNQNGQEAFIPDIDENGYPTFVDISTIQKLERTNLKRFGIF